ncbi:MAG: hypothetical protein SVE93_04030 [Candidatus Thermoplasmatota archaeon]|nr:hypothetical protein [Candidatus Thermoplasmatota archaeon]
MSLESVLKAAERSEFYAGRQNKKQLLTKRDIAEHGPGGTRKILTGEMRDCYLFSSGGTTSTPTFAVYTKKEFDRSTDFLARDFGEIIGSDDNVANLLAPGNLWTAYAAVDRALNKIGCNILPLGSNAPNNMIARILEDFSATVLIGCPSSLLSIASAVKGSFCVEKIIYGGEFLYKGGMKLLKESFGADNFFSFYGPVESGYVGIQKKGSPSTVHTVAEEYHLVEITDEGRIVLTNLDRELMPIIRFDTGDMGRWCGKNRFELSGRVGEEMKVGGAWISYRTIYEAVSEVCSPIALQLIISSDGASDKLEVRLETAEEIDRREVVNTILMKLRENDDAFIGEFFSKGSFRLDVEALPPGAIERVEKTGKVKRIIDLRDHQYHLKETPSFKAGRN